MRTEASRQAYPRCISQVVGVPVVFSELAKKQPRRHDGDKPDKIILSDIHSWKAEIGDARKLANEALRIYADLIAEGNYTHAAWFLNLAKGFMQVRHRAMKEKDFDELREKLKQICKQ